MKAVTRFQRTDSRRHWLAAVSIAAITVGATPAFAQEAPAAPADADAGTPAQEIVVTGFRQSLQAALNVKKQ